MKQIHYYYIVIRIFERIDELPFCRKFFAIDQIQKVFGVCNRVYIFGVCVIRSVWVLWNGGQVAFTRSKRKKTVFLIAPVRGAYIACGRTIIGNEHPHAVLRVEAAELKHVFACVGGGGLVVARVAVKQRLGAHGRDLA